jgi:methyl-accepting chemotaxis protein
MIRPTVSAPRPGPRLLAPLMRPGLQLMQGLRMRSKLALVAGSLVLPLLALMGLSVAGQLEQRTFTVLELQGTAVADAIVPLVVETQKHRGLHNRVLSGDTGAAAERDASGQAMLAALAAMDQQLSQTPGYSLETEWKPLRGVLQGLAGPPGKAGAAAAFQAHTQAVDALRRLALVNAEASGLVLDPEPRSYYLMDVVVNHSIPLAESAALARGLGAGVLTRGSSTPSERAELLALAGQLHSGLHDTAGKLAALERAGGVAPGSWPRAQAELQKFEQLVRNTFGGDSTAAQPRPYFELGTQAIEQLINLHNDTTTRLRAELQARVARIHTRIGLEVAVFSIGLLALAYLLSCFTASFRQSIRALHRGTEAIANGDLSHLVQVPGRDELAEIGQVVEMMSRRLSALVAEIRTSASLVNLTGQQVSSGSHRLAARTDEQASSLRSSVDAIHSLSGAVTHNADAARKLDALTGRLRTQAEEGSAAMQDTVQAMQQMQAASARVAEVVSVIDDVAFQTGMLSLNAAIEAARAGEAGKGFAVVASEVRQLAQRCAESADEIRRLISDAGLQVEMSSTKLGHVSVALATIVEGVREVSQQLGGISESSAQQSAGLQDVTQTVGNLDEITRENAALVEESSAASSSLVDRAGRLREAVASMRLRQGSADEALALVQRAVAHVDTVGRVQALADFHAADGGWVDRDLYLFCLDRSGTYVAHAAKPDMVGQTAASVPGADPQMGNKLWAAADAGGGWVPYIMLNIATGETMDKESYVLPLGEGTLVGCGIYRSEMKQAPAKQRAVAWSRRDEKESAHALA